jgi:hypothetical protein
MGCGMDRDLMNSLKSVMNSLIKMRLSCNDQRINALLDEAFEYMVNAEYELELLYNEKFVMELRE